VFAIGFSGLRCLNTKALFSKETEFQSRHIGPREHDQRQMLDELGFKVKRKYRIIIIILIGEGLGKGLIGSVGFV